MKDKKDLTKCEEIELSLRKKFHKSFSKFCEAINAYELVLPNDKIMVCVSGGKDSFFLAKLFQELKRHNKFNFDVVFVAMDPGYSKTNRELIESNAKLMEIPLQVFETKIFESVLDIPKYPCYVCARMRRGHLYAKAKELGCNKIALGHHFDDVIETTLMSMLFGGQIETMMPKLKSDNFESVELIRPLYLVREKEICHWRDYNNLKFLQCACKFTVQVSEEEKQNKELSSKRKFVKNLIADLSKKYPQIENSIFASTSNVNLAKVLEYKDKKGNRHNFLDDYNDK